MIHLLTAYKYNPNGSAQFWIGSVAPDLISERTEKDKTHFRDRLDRPSALMDLAQTMDLNNDLNKGILLHLIADYYWDTGAMQNFIENWKDGSWFLPYRQEIALAGAWLFHHKDWSKKVWNEMLEYPISNCKDKHGIITGDLNAFINRSYKWHSESDIGPSQYFTPDFVEEFTSRVALDFKEWLT
jgi:hypothetical protein